MTVLNLSLRLALILLLSTNQAIAMAKSRENFDVICVEEHGDKHSPLINKSETVEFPLSDRDKEIVKELKDRAYENEGVGLAAPQIGQARNMAVIYIPDNAALLRENVQPYPLHVIINASYEPVEEDGKWQDFEGCYSVRDVYAKVNRYKSIKVKYQDENGRHYSDKVSGFYARVLQHEIDHLHGHLITDRLDESSIFGPPREMLKIRRKELPEDKRKLFDDILKLKGIEIEE